MAAFARGAPALDHPVQELSFCQSEWTTSGGGLWCNLNVERDAVSLAL